MADISLIASGDHGNATTAKVGQTWTLVGFTGGEVPLALQAKGSSLDVSTYSLLRLVLNVSAMANRYGYENGLPGAAALRVAIEHRPTSSDPWELLHLFQPQKDLGSQRVNLGAFHPFVRVSWWFARGADADATVLDQVAITWALTGEGV